MLSQSSNMASTQRSSKRHGSCRAIDIHRHLCIIALRSDFHLKRDEPASGVRCVCINWWKFISRSIVHFTFHSGTVEQRHSGTLAPIAVMLPLPRNGYVARTVLVNKCASTTMMSHASVQSHCTSYVCKFSSVLRLLLTGIIEISPGGWFS